MKHLLILAVLAVASCSSQAPVHVAWPQLPSHGFLKGRAATQVDVNAGNAAFAVAPVPSAPLNVEIPQYALYRAEGKSTPVILIQAEAAGGKQIAAGRAFDGSELVGMLSEFQLLGTARPAP